MSYTNKQTSNAEALADATIPGLCHFTQISITVEGKSITHYESFHLKQSATTHHHFTLTLGHDSLGVEQDHQLEDTQKLMGKRIRATFSYKDVTGSPSRDFVGVITKVGFGRQKTNSRIIILQGYSPTILLDGAPHVQSFGGKQPISLRTIATNVIKEGLDAGLYKSSVEPGYTGNISYSSQYEETHYNYLARTAEAYGEQFFYDGNTLHFGKLPTGEKAISLIVGRDIDDVFVEMDTKHVNRNMYGYNSYNHEKLSTAETKITHQSTMAKAAYAVSEKTFKTPSLTIAPIKAATHKDIEATQKSANGSMSVNVFTTSGVTTSVPFLYPGCLVELNMPKPASAASNYFTKLMIIEVEHEVDILGNYSGCFKAIGADTGYLPRPAFTTPIAQTQVATVTDNKDTQGRVQVCFDWQFNGNTTEWIRVMSPDAGGSEKVGKNRGFVAIPEKGDLVMVGFVHNHPDRPFVMGGVFHGKVGSGGGSDNNIKSLTSKSGHTVQLNDGGGITVKDKTGGNHIVIDGNNKITLTSSQTIVITNGKASMTLEEDEMTLLADKITLAKAGGKSSKIEIMGIDTTLHGEMKVKVNSDAAAEMSSEGTVGIKAQSTLTTDAALTTVQSKGMTNIKGAMVNLN